MSTADGVVLIVLLAFACWGAIRGPLRQLLSLGLLAVGFLLAPILAPRIDPLLAKIGGLAPAENAALAWGVSVFGVLVGGGLLLAALSGLTSRVGAGGAAGRGVGALLGAVKGGLCLLIVGYALLAWPAGDSGTGIGLRRDSTGAVRTSEARPGWREQARHSRSATWLVEGGRTLRRVVPLPAWVRDTMHAVEADVAEGR